MVGNKTASSKLKVVYRPIASLVPYGKNSRTHSDAQIDQVAGSIKEFGWTNPILLDGKGGVIAGHARLEAAKRMGLADVPCIELAGLSEAQKRAYVIADNRLALSAGWDTALLSLELMDLKGLDFDLSLMGFDELELAELMNPQQGPGLTDPDEVPEAPKVPVTVSGDLWLLGRNRILCGDSTSVTAIEKLMDGSKAGLFATDPPYGVAYNVENGSGNFGAIANDENDGPKLQAFLEECFRSWLLFLDEKAAWYLWHAQMTQGFFAAAAAAADILIHRQIIWVKPSLILGHGDYHWKHELCFYGWRRGHRPNFFGERNQTTVWNVAHDEHKRNHPTQKPVELFRIPIENHTSAGGILADPFCGSGSQVIAAEMFGRSCYAMEIDPIYVDVAVERWQNFTSHQAILEGDGRTFDEIKAARGNR
jgi:DNA modification methylase